MNTYLHEAIRIRMETVNEESILPALKKIAKGWKLKLSNPIHKEVAKKILIDNEYRLITELKQDKSIFN